MKITITEESTIKELKEFADENEIIIPTTAKTKLAIFKVITDEVVKRREANEEPGEVSTTDEGNEDEQPAMGIDIGSGSDQTSDLIIRIDSSGVHTYDRATGSSTFKQHEVL